MLFMKLLTNRPQMFADVRTYWSADSVKRVTGYDIEGVAKDAGGFIHLINSGACCLDACGEVKDADGNGVIKPWYDVTDGDIEKMLAATTWNAADNGYFRGGGFSSRFLTRAQMPATMIRLNIVKGLGPVLQIAEAGLSTCPTRSPTFSGREPTTPGPAPGSLPDATAAPLHSSRHTT